MVQITTSLTALKEHMLTKSNSITLITGLPGSGKNYLCSVLVKDRLDSLGITELDSSEMPDMVVDLDRYCHHEKTTDGRDRWLVNPDELPMFVGAIIVGKCDNYSEVLAKVATFRQSTGTPVVFVYSIPSFQLFTQANLAKAKEARESKNPFAENFQHLAELDREAVFGQVQRSLGLLTLAITSEFAPELFSELDSAEISMERFSLLARKLFGPLDRYESLLGMMEWIQRLFTVAELSFVAHRNEKDSDAMITKGWHDDSLVYKVEVAPVRRESAQSTDNLFNQKGGEND